MELTSQPSVKLNYQLIEVGRSYTFAKLLLDERRFATLISAYILTMTNLEDDRENFYEELEALVCYFTVGQALFTL